MNTVYMTEMDAMTVGYQSSTISMVRLFLYSLFIPSHPSHHERSFSDPARPTCSAPSPAPVWEFNHLHDKEFLINPKWLIIN